MTTKPRAAAAADTEASIEPASTDPTSEQPDPSTDPGPYQPDHSALHDKLEKVLQEVQGLRAQQDLQGQLLVLQAGVLRDVQQLMIKFGPVIDQWAAAGGSKLAGFLGRRGQQGDGR